MTFSLPHHYREILMGLGEDPELGLAVTQGRFAAGAFRRRPHPFGHVAPQLRGYLGRGARDPSQTGHVEERLVDRDALDEGRRVAEHLEDGPARRRVGRHAPDLSAVRALVSGPRLPSPRAAVACHLAHEALPAGRRPQVAGPAAPPLEPADVFCHLIEGLQR